MNATAIAYEPPRFGLTGNFWMSDMRWPYLDDAAISGGLDAPSYIAKGGVTSCPMPATKHAAASHYISHTDARG